VGSKTDGCAADDTPISTLGRAQIDPISNEPHGFDLHDRSRSETDSYMSYIHIHIYIRGSPRVLLFLMGGRRASARLGCRGGKGGSTARKGGKGGHFLGGGNPRLGKKARTESRQKRKNTAETQRQSSPSRSGLAPPHMRKSDQPIPPPSFIINFARLSSLSFLQLPDFIPQPIQLPSTTPSSPSRRRVIPSPNYSHHSPKQTSS
jgi:hypothetical protein